MIGIVDVTASLPLASVSVASPLDVALGLATGVLILVAVAWRSRRGRSAGSTAAPRAAEPKRGSASTPMRFATGGLVVTIAVAGAVAVTRPPGVARISVLDVGQGDAILVEGSRGGRLLVDGGPDPDRLLVQLDRRIPPWDRQLDAVILTHPHEDHVAGLALLLARYHVARVFEPGMRGPGSGYAAWIDRLGQASAPARSSIAAGDRLAVDEIAMRVLWPIRGQVPLEPTDSGTGINNVSVVLLGTIGARRFLLAGDVEQDIDPSLLAEGLPRLDFLKVAHHGSRTATTEPFVEAVRPRIAVASAGTGNPYGHPARSTIDRLRAAGARVYRTDRDGTVTVAFDPAGMTVKAEPRSLGEIAVPQRSVVAAVAPRRGDGPRRILGCAIPRSTPATSERRPTRERLAQRLPGASAALRYHRDDAPTRPDCSPDDRPAPLRLGRRRAGRRAARRPLCGGARRPVRIAARALGPARGPHVGGR